jgi:thiamine-phosphate pyrophosphorylase
MMKGLYLVTPNWDDTDRMIAATRAALDGGAAMVQYRHKEAGTALRMEQAAALLAVCRRYNRPLVINDHVDLCVTLDADGVHVGGTDVSVRTAREQLGRDKIVGASCYGDLDRAHSAQVQGATYAAFGGFYPSQVKKYTFRTDPSILEQARQRIALPLVVIGGMTPENARPLVAKGAHMVAAITSIYAEADPCEAAKQFDQLFALQRVT